MKLEEMYIQGSNFSVTTSGAVYVHPHRLPIEGCAIYRGACSKATEGAGRDPGNQNLEAVLPYLRKSVWVDECQWSNT